MNIDQEKLRQFWRDKQDAVAAMHAANERLKAAREPLNALRLEMGHAYRLRHPGQPDLSRDFVEEFEKKNRARFEKARAAIARAERDADLAGEKFQLAARLWNRVRDFAEEHGALPTDLKGQ